MRVNRTLNSQTHTGLFLARFARQPSQGFLPSLINTHQHTLLAPLFIFTAPDLRNGVY